MDFIVSIILLPFNGFSVIIGIGLDPGHYANDVDERFCQNEEKKKIKWDVSL
jgi:hypothetical protein